MSDKFADEIHDDVEKMSRMWLLENSDLKPRHYQTHINKLNTKLSELKNKRIGKTRDKLKKLDRLKYIREVDDIMRSWRVNVLAESMHFKEEFYGHGAMMVLKKYMDVDTKDHETTLELTREGDKFYVNKHVNDRDITNANHHITYNVKIPKNVKDVTSICKFMWDTLNTHNNITTLILTDVKLNDTAANHIEQFLSINNSVIHLTLNNCDISDSGGFFMLGATHDRLRSLSIHNNELGRLCVDKIARMIKNNQRLEGLHLYNITFSGTNIDEIVKEMIHNSNTIVKLTLKNVGLTDINIKTLMEFLLTNKSIKMLDITDNKANIDTVCPSIMDAIVRNRTLKTLRLFGNSINTKHSKELLKTLEQSTKMQDICLSRDELA